MLIRAPAGQTRLFSRVREDVSHLSQPEIGATSRARHGDADLGRFWQLSTDLFAVVDETGRFVSVNPAWDRVTGWRDEQLLGRRNWDRDVFGDGSAAQRIVDSLMQIDVLAHVGDDA